MYFGSKKVMDIGHDDNEHNYCDVAEMLMCIQAWHEMINPGHHTIRLHSDGSGCVEYAVNCPVVYKIPLHEREPIISFRNLDEFVRLTRTALEEDGYKIVDTRNESSLN